MEGLNQAPQTPEEPGTSPDPLESEDYLSAADILDNLPAEGAGEPEGNEFTGDSAPTGESQESEQPAGEDVPAEPVLYDWEDENTHIVLDGKPVTKAEVREAFLGQMRQADHTRGKQELAERAKQFEQARGLLEYIGQPEVRGALEYYYRTGQWPSQAPPQQSAEQGGEGWGVDPNQQQQQQQQVPHTDPRLLERLRMTEARQAAINEHFHQQRRESHYDKFQGQFSDLLKNYPQAEFAIRNQLIPYAQSHGIMDLQRAFFDMQGPQFFTQMGRTEGARANAPVRAARMAARGTMPGAGTGDVGPLKPLDFSAKGPDYDDLLELMKKEAGV